MRIILARHGDVRNGEGRFHGLTNEPLSSDGRSEIYQLARNLKSENPSSIYYSPIKRTAESADILGNELGIPATSADALHPLNLGKFVGKDIDSNLDKVRYYLEHPDEQIPGGQSVNDWAEQYLPFFEKHFSNSDTGKSSIFMTHGRNIVLTRAHLNQDELAPAFDTKTLSENKRSTEHGGYAVATPPNHFQIVNPKAVKQGQS